jgi:hypothetical protein
VTKRVILHVGTPKTGTSYLQDVLFRNRRTLSAHGILYAADRFDAHFLAALDLMRLPWGGLEREAVGAWDRLAEQVRGWGGETAIISHEILAAASRSQVGRALTSLGHAPANGRDGRGVEVHLVLSVRDLVRQIPAEWQENVKHRSAMSYARFLSRITDPSRNSRIASWFWSVQEIPEILDRWGADLPPERVHLVTVPSPGGAPDLLWKRFSQAFGLEGIDLELGDERVNPSLGVPETALIRRINRSANRVLEPSDYRPLVRELLAHQTLSSRVLSPRLAIPPEQVPWVQEREAAFVAEIERRGYDVVGDLHDLRGNPTLHPYADPDRPRERDVAGAAVDAVKALLLETARLRAEESRLRAELDEAQAALRRSYLRPSYRLREKAVKGLARSRAGRGVLSVYRLARGRSSRSA